MPMTSPSSPSDRIALLFDRSSATAEDLERAIDLPEGVTFDAVLDGSYELSPTDLAAVADVLDVPVMVLTGRVPFDRHFGVSLRLGNVPTADVPDSALKYADRVLDYRALLDSWLGEVISPLSEIDMSIDGYYQRAGEESAERVRDALDIGDNPIFDLVGLVESLAIPVISWDLPDGVHGLNIRDEREGSPSRIIVISSNDQWTRQRYTLAHELAHALYDDEGQIIIDRVEVPEVLPELRAESFARHLLLPRRCLRFEVDRARTLRNPWETVVANVMIQWGLSRQAILRSLIDDGLAEPNELQSLRLASIEYLMTTAGLLREWKELSTGEHEQSGSPWMVDRAVQAYGNGWVGVGVVADLLGEDVEITRRRLASQG